MKKILAFLIVMTSLFSLSALPDGYSKVKLGMSLDDLKDTLKKDYQFGYRGDRDVSLSPHDGQVLIETDASYEPFSFLDRCYFQFADEKLYIITVNLRKSKMDYYSVLKKLCEKYGNPTQLNPQKAVWEDENVIMSIERPLALKYVDAKAFAGKTEQSSIQNTTYEQACEEFLNGL